MRGIPLLEIIAVLALFIAAAVPLAHLTSSDSSAPTAPPPAETAITTEGTPTFAYARFAHAPEKILLGGVELTAPDFDAEFGSVPSASLSLEVTWPEGTPETAVTVTVEPENHRSFGATFWGSGAETLITTLTPTP